MRFRTTSQLDRKYHRNATRHCQSENGIANYGHTRTGRLNLVYFGPQMAKIGPEFWPTQRAAIRLGSAMHLVYKVFAYILSSALMTAHEKSRSVNSAVFISKDPTLFEVTPKYWPVKQQSKIVVVVVVVKQVLCCADCLCYSCLWRCQTIHTW